VKLVALICGDVIRAACYIVCVNFIQTAVCALELQYFLEGR